MRYTLKVASAAEAKGSALNARSNEVLFGDVVHIETAAKLEFEDA